MRKLIYCMALLLSLLFIPYTIKTKSEVEKKPFLMAAPDNNELNEQMTQAAKNKVPEKKGNSKNSKPNNKTSKDAKAPEKKSVKKKFEITDSLKPKEHHQPGTLGYKHWTGWYYPTKFVLTLNDTELIRFDGTEFTRKNKSVELNPNEPFTVEFVWEFLHGRREGWRAITFKLDPDATQISINFDWKDEWQVIIDQAKPLKSESGDSKKKEVEVLVAKPEPKELEQDQTKEDEKE